MDRVRLSVLPPRSRLHLPRGFSSSLAEGMERENRGGGLDVFLQGRKVDQRGTKVRWRLATVEWRT